MLKPKIIRDFRASIQMLLTLVLMIGISSSSAKNSPDPIKSTGLLPYDDQADLKPVDFHLVVSSKSPIEPIVLRYLTRLLGDDWLGADWMYIGLGEYRYPALDENGRQLYVINPLTGVKTPQWKYARFWTDPGPASLTVSDTLWVWGYDAGSHRVYADSLLVNPPASLAPPDNVSASGKVLAVSGQTITIQDSAGIRSIVTVDAYTTYSFRHGEGLPRPKDGLWLNISWLTGPAGLLGRYDGFHGTYRGILRLDFSPP
jgi:hypothetical protein